MLLTFILSDYVNDRTIKRDTTQSFGCWNDNIIRCIVNKPLFGDWQHTLLNSYLSPSP